MRRTRMDEARSWIACVVSGVLLVTAGFARPIGVRAQQPDAAGGLKIVVIEGEDAVNIIQQKTAVAPVVEVRDRNDQPVAGVLLTFAIRRGGSFGGKQTYSLLTNAAGRGSAAGFTPAGTGSLQINVTASFQGQTATATITQTNFATAAQAAQAGRAVNPSSGGSSGTSAGSAGAAVGGGISGVAIAIGAAAAVGGVVAIKTLSGGSDSNSTGTNGGGTGTTQTLAVSGPFTLNYTYSWDYLPQFGIGSCSMPETMAGTLRMALSVQSSGAASGTMDMTPTTNNASAITCSSIGVISVPVGGSTPTGSVSVPMAGTSTNLTGQTTQTFNESQTPSTSTWTWQFAGSVVSGVVNGTLTQTATLSAPTLITRGGATGSTQVTLR